MYTVSLTSQGQISIPVQLRKAVNFGATKKVSISKQGDSLIIRPVVDFLELSGSLKTNKKPLTNNQMHDVFSKNMVNSNNE